MLPQNSPLGWSAFPGVPHKLLIKPSTRNIKASLANVRETIRANRSAKPETLICVLNPMIRGWANYHRHDASKDMYSVVDHHIWRALWRWARRRHPRKSCAWVRRKYFHTHDQRHWVFSSQTGKYDEPRTLMLHSATATRIVRHVRVKSDANPFDPAWDFYFAQRKCARMLERLQERSFPKRLCQQQEGRCPVCGQLIGEDDRWTVKPGLPLESGGTRSFCNLRLLHS